MTEDQRETLRSAVLDAILVIAPDLEPDELGADADLHEELGLDSIDLVNVASEIATRTGVEIPESAASALRTVGDLVAAVLAHGGRGA
jgi:acyl carrier protein